MASLLLYFVEESILFRVPPVPKVPSSLTATDSPRCATADGIDPKHDQVYIYIYTYTLCKALSYFLWLWYIGSCMIYIINSMATPGQSQP